MILDILDHVYGDAQSSGNRVKFGELAFAKLNTNSQARGILSTTDIDTGEARFKVLTDAMSTYGIYSIDANGIWTYNVDNSNSVVHALNTGETLTDSFTVQTIDGTSEVVSITISGATDESVSIGTVIEDGTLTASGDINIIDADTNNADIWQVQNCSI